MGNVFFFVKCFNHTFTLFIALDPRFKLGPYGGDRHKFERAKQMLIHAASFYINPPKFC